MKTKGEIEKRIKDLKQELAGPMFGRLCYREELMVAISNLEWVLGDN